MMKKLIRTAILLSLVISSLSVLPALVYAEEYTVKPALLIPADWKDKFTFLQKENYTKNIIPKALKEIQDYYWQKTGKTFKINSGFDVIYSTKKISELENTKSPYEIYAGLEGEKLLPSQASVTRVIWIIGTPSNSVVGENAKDTGIITIRDEALRWLAEPVFNRLGKYSVAHELGHAFGLDFAGYSLGHPCTILSENECIKEAPKPYPPAKEWNESIMGYGSQSSIYSRGLLSVGFNNTSSSPEIWKLYKSPFINPENDAPPPFTSKPPPFAEIAQILPNPVNDGAILEIKGSGFKRGTFKIYRQDENGQEQEKNFYVEQKDDDLIKIRLLASPNIIPPNSETKWKIVLKPQAQDKDQPEAVEASEELIIKGSSPRSIDLKVDFSVTCGEDRKEPVEAIVKLVRVNSGPEKKEETLIQAQSSANDDGWGQLVYTVDELDNYQGEYYLVAEPLSGISVPDRHKVVAFSKDFLYYYISKTAPFNFPECPDSVSATSSPSPAPSATGNGGTTDFSGWGAGTGTGSTTGSNSQSQVAKLQISNYADFRESNAFGDFGSPTEIIDNPSGYKVTWTLSTLASDRDKNVYVRTFEGDNYTDYTYFMTDEEITQVPFSDPLIEITAQAVNKTIGMTAIVNGQSIDIDLESGTRVQLEGDPREEQDFDIPYEVEDSKDGIKQGFLKIAYRLDGSASPSPLATGKTIRGFYCYSSNQMMKFYSDDFVDYNCTCGKIDESFQDCGTDEGDFSKTVCQNKSQADAQAAGLEMDAECVEPGEASPSPTGSATRQIVGWRCRINEEFGSEYIEEVYNQGLSRTEQTCSQGQRCQSKTPPEGYDYDAECVGVTATSEPTPAPTTFSEDQSCKYFKNGENNCMYSAEDGKCYVGHIEDQATCNWAGPGGVICFNPRDRCDYYICGPVQCPSE